MSATLAPRRSTMMRSATANTSGMRWLMNTMAMPCSRSRRTRLSTSATWRTEIAAVGSSISTIFGLDSRVRAIATAWRWPPDMCAHHIARPRLRLQLGEQLGGAPAHGLEVEHAQRPDPARELASHEDVDGGGQVVAQGQILIDDLDPAPARVGRPLRTPSAVRRRAGCRRSAESCRPRSSPASTCRRRCRPSVRPPRRPRWSARRRRAREWRRSASRCPDIPEPACSASLAAVR